MSIFLEEAEKNIHNYQMSRLDTKFRRVMKFSIQSLGITMMLNWVIFFLDKSLITLPVLTTVVFSAFISFYFFRGKKIALTIRKNKIREELALNGTSMGY